jgi:glycosyltransferase involved in cell wall biosynthesis
VVVAGGNWGQRSSASIRREAQLFRVDDRVRIVERPSNAGLRQLLRSSKLFCAMTHREGSYIAVAEALMAGVPVAMFANAIVGTKAYINEATGFLLQPDRPLSRELDRALERAESLRPQAWAKENIAAEKNSVKLNRLLAEWADDHGMEWTRNVEPFYCEYFDFHYFNDHAEGALASEYARLRDVFGLTVERNIRQPESVSDVVPPGTTPR